MSDPVRFTLRIEGLTPEDLPMRRLADYLGEFAKLLGEEASTRFDGVYPGSARVAALVQPVAVPKVRNRLTAARDDARNEAHRRFMSLDDMLADDNASGTVSEDGRVGTILNFPGVRGRTSSLPPVSEAGAVQGVLIRIGGRDESAHATLRDDDRYYNCTMSRDIDRALAKHLFGNPVRLHGRGRWRRTRDGKWELMEEGFRVTDIEPLDPSSLRDTAAKLQAAGGFGLPDDDDTWAALREWRDED
jgi:hypothetical protein